MSALPTEPYTSTLDPFLLDDFDEADESPASTQSLAMIDKVLGLVEEPPLDPASDYAARLRRRAARYHGCDESELVWDPATNGWELPEAAA
jgi:hypothetical protein